MVFKNVKPLKRNRKITTVEIQTRPMVVTRKSHEILQVWLFFLVHHRLRALHETGLTLDTIQENTDGERYS